MSRLLVCMILTGFMLLPMGGCGGRKVVPTKPIEVKLPEELAKAFEVKELPPEPEPAEVAADPSKKKTIVQATAKKRVTEKKRATKKSGAKKARKNGKGSKEDIVGPGNEEFAIPNRRPKVDPVWVGEKIWMDVSWLNTKAGEFLLEVLPFKEMNGRKVYDLKGTARTSDLFSLIYKAEDWVESFVDYEGWFPYKFVLHGDETKHIRDHLELFDHGAKKQYVHVVDNRITKKEIHEKKGFMDLDPLSQDSLSALYYARTLDLKEGTVLHFPMTTSGRQRMVDLTVIKREEVYTKMGYVKAIKTKVETRFNNVLQTKGDAFIWFSDDERKFPVRFEAKVRIGWVEGEAKRIEPGTPPEPVVPAGGQPEENKAKDAKDKGTRKTTSHGAVMETSAVAGASGPRADEPKGKKRVWFKHLLDSYNSGQKK